MKQYLEVFVMVAEKKNFSRAAEELHMTQPAVSQYIRALEESMGTRLLERSNKYVRLNKAGEIVFHYAKEILGLYVKMQNSVDDLINKATGSIIIGASYTFGEYILPHIIAQLQQNYPEITPSIQIHNTKEIIELVLDHQLDVGFIEGNLKNEHLTSEVILEDEMFIVASPKHPLFKMQKEICISDLDKETWILREIGSGTREATENFFRMHKLNPKRLREFGSTQLIKESVEAGLGITLLSRWAIEKELTNHSIEIINVKGLPFKRDFSMITNTPYQIKALKTFIDTLHHYLANQQNFLER
ncbi:LysR family transcriptional regulator [Tepidibacillus fermentans]|uniref:DNA-binding transcriptional LysR family regulator n=1 Tax=Tepidibacillus fermentans TaxID=1281767 RepID=A0A4R3KJA8_9BACI|nr:LysR family transcriptional regulator [Tepidibacillus fermentans]TCS83464.1 DNA-binding transcriptional LysR family regulator [Tepidibacillus fermentans]